MLKSPAKFIVFADSKRRAVLADFPNQLGHFCAWGMVGVVFIAVHMLNVDCARIISAALCVAYAISIALLTNVPLSFSTQYFGGRAHGARLKARTDPSIDRDHFHHIHLSVC